jgi:hypothetical protein
VFLKYWLSSRDFNKLVIKANMHANTYFLNFYCTAVWLVVALVGGWNGGDGWWWLKATVEREEQLLGT